MKEKSTLRENIGFEIFDFRFGEKESQTAFKFMIAFSSISFSPTSIFVIRYSKFTSSGTACALY